MLVLASFLHACSLQFSGSFRTTCCLHTQYHIQFNFILCQRTVVVVGLAGLCVTNWVYRKFIWREPCWRVLLYCVSIVCWRKMPAYLRALSSIRSYFSFFFQCQLIRVEHHIRLMNNISRKNWILRLSNIRQLTLEAYNVCFLRSGYKGSCISIIFRYSVI